LGAKVTGVDFSDKAIALAKKLSDELNISAKFVQSDIYELSNVLNDKFDIVFTSYGVLCWLDDLQGWANTIHHFLKPGGMFLIVEEHPLSCLFEDASEPSLLKVGYSYFNKEAMRFSEEHTYTDSTSKIENTENYQWIHTLEEIISSLIKAGLQIQSFKEYAVLPYRRFPWMVQDSNDWWVLPPECKHTVPLLFSLKAKRL
jgi:ubiquinone/menaquinone biosynthesis C-methylase UbiE